ncbi:GGDEF domain-containing protein [Pseudoalteromonas sp. MMG010]|uniref:GGDEF domain-containing protein n=1 Tax=Pseudoalteromonas sp. MMG010 TaxID=2822685 RepID=UPI001B3A77A5|nr:GGDEF domain-containing protein [Pseudoalteromonas sp. MMG010]MBQ4832046.1 GGDEF domain-containing protein [Pseudoalteromonas sp. MMG010]
MENNKSKAIPDNPKFLLRSTRNVAMLSVLAIAPFTIYDFYATRNGVGILGLIITLFCAYNAYICFKGVYKLSLNLFVITPLLMGSSLVALHEWGVVASFWSYPAVLTCYFVLPLHFAKRVNLFYLLFMLPVGWHYLDTDVSARFYAVLIAISIFALFTLREIYSQHFKLHRLSTTDVLTGLNNRLLLGESLRNAIDEYQNEDNNACILMVDLDHFKRVNDQFGHDEGDKVLKSVAKIMKSHSGEADMLFRLGGEEFLILLPEKSAHDALMVAEKIRVEVQNKPMIDTHTVTVSIGICELTHFSNWKEWLKECDERLYLAKNNGRNKVVFKSCINQ